MISSARIHHLSLATRYLIVQDVVEIRFVDAKTPPMHVILSLKLCALIDMPSWIRSLRSPMRRTMQSLVSTRHSQIQ